MVARRLAPPRLSALGDALDDGEVVRSYAFRGGAYVFSAETAADLLTARRATRVWQTRRWQEQGGFALDEWEPLREAVRGMLRDGPLTREEISVGLGRTASLRHLAAAARGAGADSLYKPLHWWGDIGFGPSREGAATFRLLDLALDGVDLASAGRRAVRAYLHSYAPVTDANLAYWFTEGLGVPAMTVRSWVADLGEEIVAVDVDGTAASVLAADLDDLRAARRDEVVRLLPAYDPWVFGPGTADPRIVPADRRALASNGAHVVLVGGRVTGTWKLRSGALTISPFGSSVPSADRLDGEVARLSSIVGEPLELTVDRA